MKLRIPRWRLATRFFGERHRVSGTERVLAFAFGALIGASAVFALPALSLLFAPLFLWLLHRDDASPRRGFSLGWYAGWGCNAVAFSWIVGLLQDFAYFPWPAAAATAMLFTGAQGLTFAFAASLVEGLQRRGWSRSLTLAPAIAFAVSTAPHLFPWHPSTAMVEWPRVAQLAEWGGAPILDLFVLGTGSAFFAACHRRRGAALLLLAMIAATFAIGHKRLEDIRSLRANAPIRSIGVVQPNVGIHEKHDFRLAPLHLAQLQASSRSLERRGADIVLWPESAYPYTLGRSMEREPPGRAAIRGEGVRGPLLVGTVTEAGRCQRYNSVVGVDRHGRIAGISDKVELIAFSERIPLWHWLPPLQEFFPCPGFAAGAAPTSQSIDGVSYGVLNCYEDVIPEHARTLMGTAPDVLVNFTNDAWFGDTAEPHLHQLVARLRSIETRRDLVRAVNTGVSSHISATGESVFETPTFEAASFIAEARLLQVETFWVRHGDLLTPNLLLLLLAGLFRRRRS